MLISETLHKLIAKQDLTQVEATVLLDAMLGEAATDAQIAAALVALASKGETEEELARTPQGLMEEGLGSRGYGMFACRAPDGELAFGEAVRQRRRHRPQHQSLSMQRQVHHYQRHPRAANEVFLTNAEAR